MVHMDTENSDTTISSACDFSRTTSLIQQTVAPSKIKNITNIATVKTTNVAFTEPEALNHYSHEQRQQQSLLDGSVNSTEADSITASETKQKTKTTAIPPLAPVPVLPATKDLAASTTASSSTYKIILYPFAHQVGGHTQLLTLDKATICKPLVPRELLFYLNVPKQLVDFVPSYKGVVQVREACGTSAFPSLVNQPLRSPKQTSTFPHHGHFIESHSSSHSTPSSSSCTLPSRFKSVEHHLKGGIDNHHIISSNENNNDDDSNSAAAVIDDEADYEDDDDSLNADINTKTSQSLDDIYSCSSQRRRKLQHHEQYFQPIELKVQIRQLSDEKILKRDLSQDNLLKADYISRPNDKYLLLLENVASRYQLPCILDLKMGTRQHGDDATEEKRHRQIAKCKASTSASLGVRLCGMQVYQVDYGGYLWYDKYYGRKVDEEGLKRALHQYFHNGFELNEDVIDDVIARLRLLSNAVENCPSFRFYGTSLLIAHEGCASRSLKKRCPVDVRLIDFAHTICDYNYTNARSKSAPSVLDDDVKHQQNKQHQPILTLVQQQQQQKSQLADSGDGNDATLPSSPTPPITSCHQSIGPDKGLLFGLENLMRLLNDLKSQYHPSPQMVSTSFAQQHTVC